MKLTIAALILATAISAQAQQPQPSYQLPQSGTITNWGPDGVTIYQYQDHGRTYQSFGAGGYQSQYSDGRGNITRYDFPSPDERDNHETLDKFNGEK